ncbi:MAG: hypothetical protein CBB68_07340 [Rhodospirillaceae bacterium TMED8]|nr:hypothetical protein [Magnetovibrio sp.]OUT50802.1 MAG: hypothetical protein CBB68_07340 [Rhodospirillaceae bacterium TMED8]|tara:strand:+ start:332 stop:586 length:255 start_codon:yes stop_codon:yes gene_type:complete
MSVKNVNEGAGYFDFKKLIESRAEDRERDETLASYSLKYHSKASYALSRSPILLVILTIFTNLHDPLKLLRETSRNSGCIENYG